MPGLNKKAMEKAMKQMGVKQEPIEATEVIVKRENSNLVIKNPQVMKVEMMGQESLQITGDIIEESSINEEDVKTVAEKASVSLEEAKKSLEENNGDLAEAIMSLSK